MKSSLYAKVERGLTEYQRKLINRLVSIYQSGEILFPPGSGLFRVPVCHIIGTKRLLFDGWYFICDHTNRLWPSHYPEIPEHEWAELAGDSIRPAMRRLWPRYLVVHSVYDYFLKWVV